MAKRKVATRKAAGKTSAKRSAPRRSAKRPSAKRPAKRQASAKNKAPAKKTARKPVKAAKPAARRPAPKTPSRAKRPAGPVGKVPRLDRARRTLDDRDTHDTPPSSLDLNPHGTAARSGRAGMEQSQREHRGMSPDIQAGDVDVDVEDAYFTGEEAPGGDNTTPDQDVVDDIGKALGVTYNDNEELEGADKLEKRDKHRWELDPASSEDYKNRD